MLLSRQTGFAQLSEADSTAWRGKISSGGTLITGNVERLLWITTLEASYVESEHKLWGFKSANVYQYGTFAKRLTENDLISRNFIGRYPSRPEAALCYGLVFSGSAFGFMLFRRYAGIKAQLMHDHASKVLERKVLRGNIISALLYALGGAFGYITPLISFGIFTGIALYYALPDHTRTRFQKHTKF